MYIHYYLEQTVVLELAVTLYEVKRVQEVNEVNSV